jgi:release factor glutamine methyltransferase
MTIKEILTSLCCKISPLDREILLSLAGDFSREYILAHPEKKLTNQQIKKYKSFLKRRCDGEPIAYISGKKEFYGLEFIVNKNVLIPRPETELLVEEVLQEIQNDACHQTEKLPEAIVDVGTGSGNIIISILKNLPEKLREKINFYALDVSKSALRFSKQNAKKHRVDKKIKFIESNLLEYFLKKKKNIFENFYIVSNLPYVSRALYEKNKSKLKFEPKSALLGDKKGLGHYENLFKQVKKLLAASCLLSIAIEISPEQKPELTRIIRKILPNASVKFQKDLAEKWRIARIKIIP